MLSGSLFQGHKDRRMTLSAMVARPTGRNWVRADRFGGRCKAFLCRGGTHQGNDPEAGALHGSALRQRGQVSGRDFRSQSTNLPACRGPNTHRSQSWCRARELRRPSRNRLASVLKLGYLMRPIGGVLVGHIGDKFGRRTALAFESSNRSGRARARGIDVQNKAESRIIRARRPIL
jgi:hypothetical protein